MLESRHIIRVRIDATSYADATQRILRWASDGHPARVCVANVHSVMEAFDSDQYREWINSSELVTPDGMPLVWALRLLGIETATRVYGPDLVPAVLEGAAKRQMRVGLLGGTEFTLQKFRRYIEEYFPGVEVVYAYSPPFRPLSAEEDGEITREIADSGAQILLIGLGNPKQEQWMYAHRTSVTPVMLGVGAAFDFLAGTKSQAPRWMMRSGLEWLYRFATEPRRLWKRYLKHNPRFLILFAIDYVNFRLRGVTPHGN